MAKQEFEALYERYVKEVVAPTERRVHEVFREWKEEGYWTEHGRNESGAAVPRPTQRTRTRIKRPEAVRDKFKRLAHEFPDGPTEENLPLMRDFLGARAVVYFPTHLRMIDEEIRSGRHFVVSNDYEPRCYLPSDVLQRVGLDERQFLMKGRKPSGYASLHYFIRLKSNPNSHSNPWFELQTRTMLEEVWGEIEHQLGYKQGRRTEFSVSRQFRVISTHLSALDDHFDFVYDRLTYLQARSNPEADDLLNAENLPRVLDDFECICQQDEIAGMLEILETWGVNTVHDFARSGSSGADRGASKRVSDPEQVRPATHRLPHRVGSGSVEPWKYAD